MTVDEIRRRWISRSQAKARFVMDDAYTFLDDMKFLLGVCDDCQAKLAASQQRVLELEQEQSELAYYVLVPLEQYDRMEQAEAKLAAAEAQLLCPFFDKPTTWPEAYTRKMHEAAEWSTRALQAEARVRVLERICRRDLSDFKTIVNPFIKRHGGLPLTLAVTELEDVLAAEPKGKT